MDVAAEALALGEGLGVGEASDFFAFAETLRGAQRARAAKQTLLMINDLFFIVLVFCCSSRIAARSNETGQRRLFFSELSDSA